MIHHTCNDDGTPCRHMRPLLEKAAAGESGGLADWYAHAHAERCERCENFLRDRARSIAATVSGTSRP